MERKPSLALRIAACAIASTLVIEPIALAQQPASGSAPPAAPAAADAKKPFTQQELDELLAPIALYPDALLAQVLMSATYPLEVVEAARWVKANPGLKEKALEDAMQKQTWDPSVKALTAVPQVLTMMNEKIDWTQKLGDAFLGQQAEVMKTAQELRKKADAAGNLKSSDNMKVTKTTEESVQVIKIEQPNPEVVYVPTYNPATIYGTWWYAAPPPYYYYPPGYAYGAGLAFATGVFVGAAIWGNCNWGGNNVNINVNKYNNFNKTNIGNGNNNWSHNAEHRGGVGYRDNATSQKFNKGGDRAAAQSRDQFRGRAEQGRQELGSMDKGQLNSRVDSANRASASQRGAGSGSGNFGGGDRAGASAGNRAGNTSAGNRGSGGSSFSGSGSASRGGGSSGFSGAGGGGASARASSSRGGASRGGGGGGRGGGGRR